MAALLAGRTLVGHALRNDLKALLLSHPRRATRDTAAYGPLMRTAPHVGGPTAAARRGRAAKLKDLAAAHLGLTIQAGEHSPVEDARAALLLYQRYAKEWEASLTARGKAARRAAAAAGGAAAVRVAHSGGDGEEGGGGGGAARRRERHGAAEQQQQARPAQAAPLRGGGGWSAVLSRSRGDAAAELPPPRGGGVSLAWRQHAATAAAAAGGAGGKARARSGAQMFTSE